MTTSDTLGGSPAAASGHRLLRRNRTNRVAAGVCSGLGDYFAVDPVLFRVLFATAAFFGGAGILAYLLAWAAIPEAGTVHAPIDAFIAWVRRRRVPMWLAAAVAGLLLWAIAFSWWAPGPFFPVIAVVVLLVVIFTRREMQALPPPPSPAPTASASASASAPVDLTKNAPAESVSPTWVGDARSWFDEAREASRRRRRRSLPVRIATIVTLAAALTALGIADAADGVQLQAYFWVALAVLGLGLLAGLVTRRTPLSLTPLFALAAAGAIAFAGSDASLHDGVGQRQWAPTSAPAAQYRLAFGQGVLDLRRLVPQSGPRTIDVTMAAGQVQVIAPPDMNVTVLANVHIGQLDVDGSVYGDHHGGIGLSRTVLPLREARGTPITVDVHLADGNITVDHRN